MSKTFTSRPGYAQTRGGRGRSTPHNNNNRGTQATRGTNRGRATSLAGQSSTRGAPASPTRTNPNRRGNTRGRGMEGSPGFPAYNRGSGRGRGFGGYDDPSPNDDITPGPNGTNQRPQQQDRMERRDAYTVIRPDESKRNAIARQAKLEEERYEQYKASNKLSYVSSSGTVGGGAVSEDVARNRGQQQHRQASQSTWQKSQQYKTTQRQREEEENQKKKNDARRRSEANSKKEQERKAKIGEDHKRTNAAFLDRLEQESKAKKGHKILSSSTAKNFTEAESPVDSHHSPGGATGYSPGGNGHSPGGPTDYSPHGSTGYSPGDDEESFHEDESRSPLQELIDSFPDYDQDILESILLQCNGHVGKARELLS